MTENPHASHSHDGHGGHAEHGEHGEHEGNDDGSVGVHGMLLVGSDPVYLSHLPMFMSPHNFQVILKATLEDPVARQVADLRAQHGPEALITVAPQPFPIEALSSDHAEPLTEFRADIVRGHFEHDGEIIGSDSVVTVEEVVAFARLPLEAVTRPRGDLEYLIFGDAERELYLAHRVDRAPDFDQVLLVGITGQTFTEQELDRQGRPTLTVPGREDVPSARLQPGETLAARTSAGLHFVNDVELTVLAELYFMEDELS
jgi:hypothetical protein